MGSDNNVRKKHNKIIAIIASIVVACIAFVVVLITVIIPNQKMNKAKQLLDSGDYDDAYAIFEEVGNNDAITSSKNARAMSLIESGDYEEAYALLNEIGNTDAIVSNKNDRAIALIESGDYKEAYVLFEETGNLDAITSNKNDRAKALIESGDYEEAYVLFEETGNLDAITSNKNDRAMALIESGKYEEAYVLFEETGNLDAITSNKNDRAMALIESGDYEKAYALLEEIGKNDVITSNKYDRAMSLIESGDYEAACMLLNGLNYKDSEDQLSMVKKKLLSEAKVGSYICFGKYEQDNDLSNGKEDIEWLILAKKGNKALIISKYALDNKQLNYTDKDYFWEKSTLRKWLNETFINEAFSLEEQNSLISSTVTADLNPKYDMDPGKNTTDKVFILNLQEADKYFSNDKDRRCQGTAYCYAQGAYRNDYYLYRNNVWWWLRSVGSNPCEATHVSSSGELIYYGDNPSEWGGAVRPALWINLGS